MYHPHAKFEMTNSAGMSQYQDSEMFFEGFSDIERHSPMLGREELYHRSQVSFR